MPARVSRVVEDWGRDLIGGWTRHDWAAGPHAGRAIGSGAGSGVYPAEVIVVYSTSLNPSSS